MHRAGNSVRAERPAGPLPEQSQQPRAALEAHLVTPARRLEAACKGLPGPGAFSRAADPARVRDAQRPERGNAAVAPACSGARIRRGRRPHPGLEEALARRPGHSAKMGSQLPRDKSVSARPPKSGIGAQGPLVPVPRPPDARCGAEMDVAGGRGPQRPECPELGTARALSRTERNPDSPDRRRNLFTPFYSCTLSKATAGRKVKNETSPCLAHFFQR